MRVNGTHGWSEPSNLAFASMKEPPEYYGVPSEDDVVPSENPATDKQHGYIALIACGVILFLLLVGGAAFLVLELLKKKANSEKKKRKSNVKQDRKQKFKRNIDISTLYA